jgi:hypothetical protein
LHPHSAGSAAQQNSLCHDSASAMYATADDG